MLPRNHPDRIQIAFDDHRLVANAGLLLPVTLAQHLGLREVVDSHVDLGDAPGRANPGDKLLTLVASALAGGDFIDDADVLRTGGTAGAIGCVSDRAILCPCPFGCGEHIKLPIQCKGFPERYGASYGGYVQGLRAPIPYCASFLGLLASCHGRQTDVRRFFLSAPGSCQQARARRFGT